MIKYFLSLQNKCTQYWPDPETNKVSGPFQIKHMKETEFTDYILREFEVTSESNVSILSCLNIVPCLHCIVLIFTVVMKTKQSVKENQRSQRNNADLVQSDVLFLL